MIGIKSYGAYLPKYLLPRKLIGKAWDFPVVPGTKAFALADEDSLTMAVEAGLDCLAGFDPKSVDGLYYATTTQVYTEKDSASIISTVLDLRDDIVTADFTDSLKAGSTAVSRAYETIKANDDINSILVLAADQREPEPSTMWEYGFADGAGALLIADEENIPISIEDTYSIAKNIIGPWKRREKDEFIRTFEVKMDAKFYMQSVLTVMNKILEKNNLNPKDIQHAAYYYNNPKMHAGISKRMEFERGVAQNGMFFQIGDTGTPMPMMLLIGALRRPDEDANILMVGYGDGADAILMKVRDRKAVRDLGKTRLGLNGHQKSMEQVKNYNKFIESKELLEKDRYKRKSSAVTIWRDADSVYRNYGLKCQNCGAIQYPVNHKSCYVCQTDGQLEKIKLSYKGEIFTFTLDHLVGGAYLDTPVPRCVVDLEGGGRILVNMTEIENPEKNVEIGMKVELTFRKEHEGADFINYYWKCRPVRGRPNIVGGVE